MKMQAGLAEVSPPLPAPTPPPHRPAQVLGCVSLLGAPEARTHMQTVKHGHVTWLQPPTQHTTEPKSHSTGYCHFFKALMIKHIVEKTWDGHHEKKKNKPKMHTDTTPNNTRPR